MEHVKITEFISVSHILYNIRDKLEGCNGRTNIKYIKCSDTYSNMVNDLTAHNYYFSMEILNTNEIVLYCESTDNDEDIMLQIVKDKKEISSSLELLIDMCYNRYIGNRNSK